MISGLMAFAMKFKINRDRKVYIVVYGISWIPTLMLIFLCIVSLPNSSRAARIIETRYHYHPKTYTGENMVEIHTHGNPKIVENLFKELSNMGLRLADPGEFTKTAYLNNKIDLVQAESIFSLGKSFSFKGGSISILVEVEGFGSILASLFTSSRSLKLSYESSDIVFLYLAGF